MMSVKDLEDNLKIADHVMIAYAFETSGKSFNLHTTYFSTTKEDVLQAIKCWKECGINEIPAHLAKPSNVLYIGEHL